MQLIPDCLMPPPSAFLILFCFRDKFFLPIINEPTGADKPFDKQHETESQSFVNLSTDLFSAIAALKFLHHLNVLGILYFWLFLLLH